MEKVYTTRVYNTQNIVCFKPDIVVPTHYNHNQKNCRDFSWFGEFSRSWVIYDKLVMTSAFFHHQWDFVTSKNLNAKKNITSGTPLCLFVINHTKIPQITCKFYLSASQSLQKIVKEGCQFIPPIHFHGRTHFFRLSSTLAAIKQEFANSRWLANNIATNISVIKKDL